jgi:hypothetical protein
MPRAGWIRTKTQLVSFRQWPQLYLPCSCTDKLSSQIVLDLFAVKPAIHLPLTIHPTSCAQALSGSPHRPTKNLQ